MYLDIPSLLYAEIFLVVYHSFNEIFLGSFVSGSPETCIDGENGLGGNIKEAKRCTIIILYTRLNGMVARLDLTCFLMVRMKR